MKGKGLYLAIEERDAFGISVGVVYNAENNDFQIVAMIGCFMFAIVYAF